MGLSSLAATGRRVTRHQPAVECQASFIDPKYDTCTKPREVCLHFNTEARLMLCDLPANYYCHIAPVMMHAWSDGTFRIIRRVSTKLETAETWNTSATRAGTRRLFTAFALSSYCYPQACLPPAIPRRFRAATPRKSMSSTRFVRWTFFRVNRSK